MKIKKGDKSMLSKVVTAMRGYMDAYDKNKKEFETECERIDSIYLKSSKEWNEAFTAARNKFINLVAVNKQAAIDIMNVEFEDAHNEIMELIAAPVLTEAMNMIELVKQHTMTRLEFDSVMKKYGTNYLTARALADAYANDGNGKEVFVPAADDLNTRIDILYNDVIKSINSYGGNALADNFTAAMIYNGDVVNNLINDSSGFIEQFKK